MKRSRPLHCPTCGELHFHWAGCPQTDGGGNSVTLEDDRPERKLDNKEGGHATTEDQG